MMAQIQQSVLVFSLINPHIKMKKATAHLKELNELNLILTCTAPNVFHQKLLQHDKPQFHPEHMLHMLNQHSICIPQVRLFNFMTPIERYLFSIWNNASMDVPQITLKKTFIRKEINQNIRCPPFFSASWATSWPNFGLTIRSIKAENTTTPDIITGPVIKLALRDFTRLAKAMAMSKISNNGFVIWP